MGDRINPIVFRITLVFWLFTETASANLLEVKKAVEQSQCKKLASDYSKDPSAITVPNIAQLQICLAQTLQSTISPTKLSNINIQPPRPLTKKVDTTLPTPPTPPTPPQSIKIP